ncbi:hypothetical protein [Staphylococcus argensis]|nr:hypothetical protein [Staphylococcus argensis]
MERHNEFLKEVKVLGIKGIRLNIKSTTLRSGERKISNLSLDTTENFTLTK